MKPLLDKEKSETVTEQCPSSLMNTDRKTLSEKLFKKLYKRISSSFLKIKINNAFCFVVGVMRRI